MSDSPGTSTAADSWTPVFVLPNIKVTDRIAIDQIAIESADGEICEKIQETHSSFKKFVSSFTDTFGRKVTPSIVLLRSDAPRSLFNVEVIAGFRDAVAISATTYGWGTLLKYNNNGRVLWSDAFSIHPWMIDKDYKHVVGHTLALIGLDQVERFKGQSSPSVYQRELSSSDYDDVILEALLTAWKRRHLEGNTDWKSLALFRALNMAFHASLVPGRDVTIYDRGRAVALWVSAFEILAHPQTNDTGLRAVSKLISKSEWIDPRLKQEELDCYQSRRNKIKGNITRWFYGELYRARNDFTHGNAVTNDRLNLPISGKPLLNFAPSLFRIALANFIELKIPQMLDSYDDLAQQLEFARNRSRFQMRQHLAEEALISALDPSSVEDE